MWRLQLSWVVEKSIMHRKLWEAGKRERERRNSGKGKRKKGGHIISPTLLLILFFSFTVVYLIGASQRKRVFTCRTYYITCESLCVIQCHCQQLHNAMQLPHQGCKEAPPRLGYTALKSSNSSFQFYSIGFLLLPNYWFLIVSKRNNCHYKSICLP